MPDHRKWLEFLSKESLISVEETAYRLLGEVGIALGHDWARDRAKVILGTHEVEPLPEDADRQFNDILARARHNLTGR